SRAVFIGWRDSTGCCRTITCVRDFKQGIWAHKQCDKGRVHRSQRGREDGVESMPAVYEMPIEVAKNHHSGPAPLRLKLLAKASKLAPPRASGHSKSGSSPKHLVKQI